MTPADLLLALIPRFSSLDPSQVAPADRCTFGNARAMLHRLAGKLASNDPATVALGVAQIRSVGAAWVDPRSPAALLWGEAVAAVADLAPGVEAAASPATAFRGMLEQAYQRGRADERASLAPVHAIKGNELVGTTYCGEGPESSSALDDITCPRCWREMWERAVAALEPK